METRFLKRKPILITLFVVLFILFICALPYQLIVNKCLWWNCAPERDFTLYDLTIPNDIFPSRAKVIPLRNHRDDRDLISVEEVVGGATWQEGGVTYISSRFATNNSASNRFNEELDIYTFRGDLEAELEDYSEFLSYNSEVADEFKQSCGFVLNDFRCITWARYQEFYIHIVSSIGENEMTEEGLLAMVIFLDEKMENLLYLNE